MLGIECIVRRSSVNCAAALSALKPADINPDVLLIDIDQRNRPVRRFEGDPLGRFAGNILAFIGRQAFKPTELNGRVDISKRVLERMALGYGVAKQRSEERRVGKEGVSTGRL